MNIRLEMDNWIINDEYIITNGVIGYEWITDVAFLDEGSMVNASLFLHWLEAIGDNTRIIISGDHKQLPPIGFGNVFSDLIEMFDDSVVSKLVKPMRQAEKSGILVDANKIRENINPMGGEIEYGCPLSFKYQIER